MKRYFETDAGYIFEVSRIDFYKIDKQPHPLDKIYAKGTIGDFAYREDIRQIWQEDED